MPAKDIDAWDAADQQTLPPAARRKAWRPLPNMGPGIFVDKRARESCRLACRAAVPFISNDKITRSAMLGLCRQVLVIARVYWANWDYDNQPTYGDIKKDVRQFRERLGLVVEAFDALQFASRRELNWDLMHVHGDLLQQDYVETARAALEELQSASDRVLKPNYKKVEAVAVPCCCEALVKMWQDVTGKTFSRTRENEATGKGLVFTAEGPRCIQAVMAAIDPAVEIKRLNSWMVKSGKLKTGKK